VKAAICEGVRGLLNPGGRVLMVYGELWPMIAVSWQKAVVGGPAKVTAPHLEHLVSLVEQGALRSVIDSVLPFAQIVDAHRRVDSGHKVGRVVLTFEHDH
jgi:NADPH:quinone reductase-like Zn-dependent oxidoreductase